MEFWGVEIKNGVTVKVHPDADRGRKLCLSLADVEVNEDEASESLRVFLNVDGTKLVLCTLSDKLPRQTFNLLFDRYFELSHNLKARSVYFCGHKVPGSPEVRLATHDTYFPDEYKYEDTNEDEIEYQIMPEDIPQRQILTLGKNVRDPILRLVWVRGDGAEGSYDGWGGIRKND